MDGQDGGAAAICVPGGGLSKYYNSPGRLAVIKRKFDSVTRRAEADPATFATELEILDSAGEIHREPTDTPIREIVDHCRVWESHSEQKRGSSPATDRHPKHKGESGDPREPTGVMEDSLWEEPRIPVFGANVVLSDRGVPQERGSVRNRDVSPGILSSLIARLMRAAQEDNPAEVKVPPDAGTWGPPVAPVSGTSAQSPVLGTEQVMVCFSCGHPGHGVN